MEKDIRWVQRFNNYQKAFINLENGIVLSGKRELSELERQGVIQSFEFTFELAWKVMKDFLVYLDVEVKFPREVIKQAYHYELIDDGEVWLDMMEKRNLMAHTYDEKLSELSFNLISSEYFHQLSLFLSLMKTKR